MLSPFLRVVIERWIQKFQGACDLFQIWTEECFHVKIIQTK